MQMLVKKIFFIFISLSFFSGCTNQNSPIAEANNPPIIERFYLASENVYIGESVEISWETTYTSYCVASGDWNGQKASNGSELIDINEHKTYFFSLECFGEKQNSSKIAEIEFQAKYQGIYLEDEIYVTRNSIYYLENEIMSLEDKILVDSFKFKNGYYFFWYDSLLNIASGQKIETRYIGLQLTTFENDKHDDVQNYFLASSFESNFRKIFTDDYFFICSSEECYKINNDGEILNMKISEFTSDYEIHRILYEDNLTIELIKKIPPQNLFVNDTTVYDRKKISFNEELILVDPLQDISDMNLNQNERIYNNFSAIYSFQDNSEGRIVWGQKYYLDALIQKNDFTEPEQELFIKNIEYFMSFDDLSFLFSKRYSYQRTQQLFLLHVARYFNLLIEINKIMPLENYENYSIQINLLTELLLFESKNLRTVEEFSYVDFGELGIQEYLIFGETSDFWANSINVPINYVSDYIIALVNINTDSSLDIAEKLLNINFSLVEGFQFPSWRYWSADGLRGWSDSRINVKEFTGEENNPFAADISYRSTDSESFLKSCSNVKLAERVSFDCNEIRENIFQYIIDLSLEPYLLSYFPDKEISEDLKRSIFKKFSRLSKVSDVRSLYFINSKL